MILLFIKNLIFLIKLIFFSLKTLPRDLKGLALRSRIDKNTAKWLREGLTVAKQFRKNVLKHPNKAAIIFENKTWTFQEIEDYSNKVAHSFSNKFNLKKGDAVAIFMENKPEYIATWLGLSKLGVISALINTNLKNQALVHSITVSNSKVIVFGVELKDALNEVKDQLDPNLIYVIQGNSAENLGNTSIESLMKPAPIEYFVSEEELTFNDSMLYIYTSGTTGLPKPAVIKNNRYFGAGYVFLEAAGLGNDDIVYVSLPIYHGNGGMIGLGTALIRGNTCVLRRKFSATNFWQDCIDHNCTTFIYVGEICRYLINRPPSPLDKKHSVKVAIGNGLRPNVWKEFNDRFGVRVMEFYAASEGNCITFNLTGKMGACGFLPPWNPFLKLVPIFLVKVDDQEAPIKDKNGFCIPCKAGEKGVVVGVIGPKPLNQFNGYANNKAASDKKIIENLFKQGQRAFNSGDLMVCDDEGWFYFCDRLGDTYRWKSENVSTVEIEDMISSKLESAEVIIFGVEIPGQEGKAGMAVILKQNLDIDKLSNDVKQSITSYARPVFIRISDNVEHTGTFRAQKNKISLIGYNINKTNDKIYYFDLKEQKYLPLTKLVYGAIMDNSFKL